MNKETQRQQQRETLLYEYSRALERGDFETLERVLQQAEADPALEPLILEINHVFIDEDESVAQSGDADFVRQLTHIHIVSGIVEDDEGMELPPLTVGQIVGELQREPELWRRMRHEDATTLDRLRHSEEPLPDHLTERGVRLFFERLRVSVSTRFQELFRETAIFLSIGREQGMAKMAATRKQKDARKKAREGKSKK